ncbi:MAG: TatD family deoxyribonuclease [Deltaproteobacteria bacterium]|nr:MAG: TatD family deoxyribonuclease [Deltaproteobacteria bacterium]
MLIDSHAHLDFAEYGADLDATVARAREAGLVHIVVVGQWREDAGMAGARDAIALADRDRSFFSAAAGSHPHDAARATEADLAALEEMCAQIRLAKALQKPLVVHTREADLETADILASELGPDGGVIHCFTSDWTAAQRYLALGMSLSFSGVLTFRNADAIREAAQKAPLDRVMVETDCPFLAPVPHRGKRNEPAYVALTAARLAEVRGLQPDELALATTGNARKALRLPR